MTRLGQKIQERWQLESFMEALSDDAPAPAESFTDGENPDFILHQASGQTLGIELTVLHHPDPSNSQLPLRQEEGIQESICRKLEAKWKNSEIPWGEVSIHFLGNKLPIKKDESKVVDALMEVISRVEILVEGTASLSSDTLWQHPVLGKLVSRISIYRQPDYSRPYVHAPRAAFLPSLSHSSIQKAISAKNGRCSDYRKKCDEVWLVLIHNESGLATHFDRRNLDLPNSYQMDFDRVWLLDAIKKQVLEVGKE